MRKALAGPGSGIGLWLFLSPAAAAEVTFHKDVLPILQNRCQTCHRPGEAAPMSFLTYQEVRPWAKAIREAILERKMPPWFADPHHGSFKNDRTLPQQEIDTLVAWVNGGARQGAPQDAPGPLRFQEGWTIGKPDMILEMPRPFEVPAEGTVEYQYILIPTGLTEDRWVQKVEVRPGSPSVVHHVVVFTRSPGAKFLARLSPGVPFGPPERKPPRREDDGTGVFTDDPGTEVLSTYVPGGDPYVLEEGQARLIPAGSDLIFQMHYTTNGAPTEDQTRIGLIFAKNPPRERVFNTFIANVNFRIPPREPNHKVIARVTLHQPSRLVSMFPHMHVRGKSFEYRATYPNGETEVLLKVPKYDFNWQLTYYLENPRELPKGTVLEVIAHFDNSAENPFNPDPNREVGWGEQTWDEMVAGFVDFAIDRTMDPQKLIRPPKRESSQPNRN